jgi:RNA polymerase sigma-70 factor (ECF subfamily)
VADSPWKPAFMQLLDAHGASLMAMLRRLCGRGQDAEDVFQETAARVWRSMNNCPRLRNPKSWLMTIGYRAFLDSRSRGRKHEALEEPLDLRGEGPDGLAEKNEVCDRMQAAIASLEEPVREVIALHYMGGLSLRDTAAAMGISQGTVKSRLNCALTELRRVMQ